MIAPHRFDTLGRIAMAAVLTAFVLLIVHTILRPMYTTRRDVAAFREAVEILADAEGNVDQLDAEIQRITTEVEHSHALLPRDLNLKEFLEWLGAMGRETGVRVERLSPGVVDHQALYRRQPVRVRITGDFDDIYDFLIELERNDQLSRVESLQLLGSADSRQCAAELAIALYFAPAPEEGR